MEQLSPAPESAGGAARARGERRSRSRGKSFVLALAIALFLISFMGWGLTSLFGARHADRMSESERTQLLVAFNQLKPAALKGVTESELTSAINSMQLPPTDRAALVQELSLASNASTASPADAGQAPAPSMIPQPLRLAWITLWDTHAEDGDIVQIQSGGYRREVVLMNRPTTVAIPLPPSGILNIAGSGTGVAESPSGQCPAPARLRCRS